MNKTLFDKLLHDGTFLSVFYQARAQSEKYKIPLESSFLSFGMNKYKGWFFHLCDNWGLTNLNQIKEFDKKVRSI